MKISIFALAILAIANGQIVSEGECPDLDVVQEFDLEKYAGKWYEIYRYENSFQSGGDCVIAEYTLEKDGPVKVNNTMYVDGVIKNKIGTAELADDAEEGEGKLSVNFPPPSSKAGKSNYWILDTDYTHHSLVYSCSEIPNSLNRKVFAWILSRTKSLPPASYIALDEFVKKAELFWENLRVTSQVCSVKPPAPLKFQSIMDKIVLDNEKLTRN